MDSLTLHNACVNDKYICKYYKGVYARNEFCSIKIEKSALYIVNTEHLSICFGHWIVIFVSCDNVVEIFDSFAKPLQNRHIDFSNFLQSLNKTYCMSNKRIQGLFSMKCGMFCLYFAYFRTRNISLNDILNHFSSINFIQNDYLVFEFCKYKFQLV